MQPLPSLLRQIQIAAAATRREFARQIEANPAWFLWSLRDGEPTRWPGPKDFKRTAFIHVPDVDRYFDAISNVAGIRQFDNLNGPFCAVDLVAWHRARRLGVLEAPPQARTFLNPEDYPDGTRLEDTAEALARLQFTLVDFLPLVRVEETGWAFAWFGEMSAAAFDAALAGLEAAGFIVAPAPNIQNLRNVRLLAHPRHRAYAGLDAALAAYDDRPGGSGLENWLPEQSFKLSKRATLLRECRALAELPESEWDLRARPDPAAPPAELGDPGAKNAPWLKATGIPRAWKIVAAQLGRDWHRRADGERPVVAVLDTAINYDHPALLPAWHHAGDAAPPDAQSLADHLRVTYHGTACAGLALGREAPGGGSFRGVAAGCRLLGGRIWAGSHGEFYFFPRHRPLPWMEPNLCPPERLAAAIRAAREPGGARVLSLSFQYNQEAMTGGMKLVREALGEAVDRGCVVVVAAGNVQSGDGPDLRFPADQEDLGLIVVAAAAQGQILLTGACCQKCVPARFPGPPPAAVPPLIAPAACRRPDCGVAGCGGTFAQPSDCPATRWGANVTLAAPGAELWTTDVQDFGHVPLGAGKWDYAKFYATSGATPIVAGVAALMLAVNPALSPRKVRDILRATALARPMWDASPTTDSRARRLPFGLLDAGAALAEAVARKGKKATP